MSEIDANPKFYSGTYTHGIDEKRRVQVPAKWRPQTEDFQFTLIVWPKAKEGPCLRVLPPKKMASLMADIDAMPNGDPNKTILKRVIGGFSEQVTLDKAGRICLPEQMAKAAGLEGQAVMVGLLDQFEIWSPARHEMVMASDSVMVAEAFRLME